MARIRAGRYLEGMRRAALVLSASFLSAISLHGELPRLIPRELLFGNPERTSPQLSPDGKSIAWLAADSKGVRNVWVPAGAGGSPRLPTNESDPPTYASCWAGDERQ